MQPNTRTMARFALGMALFVALVVSVVVGGPGAARAVMGLSTVDAPGDIPGTPLASSPVTGTLDATTDAHDVYQVDLAKGEVFTAQIAGAEGTDFVGTLYQPTLTSVVSGTAADQIAGLMVGLYYPRFIVDANDFSFGYVATQTATYHLDLSAAEGASPYTLKWATGKPPVVSISASRTINWGQSIQVTGTVSDPGMTKQPVELYARAWDSTDDSLYKLVASAQTGAGGAYSFTVTPTTKTYYRVVVLTDKKGYSFGQSAEQRVKVRPLLTKPATSTSVRKGRAFKIWGYVKPKHKSGNHTVYVYAYRKNSAGKYVYKTKFRTTNYNSTTYPTKTKYYTKTAKLTSAGRWKLIAKAADDDKHAYNRSSPVYLRVY